MLSEGNNKSHGVRRVINEVIHCYYKITYRRNSLCAAFGRTVAAATSEGLLGGRSGALHSGTNTGPREAKPGESICAGGNAHARQQCCELTAGTKPRVEWTRLCRPEGIKCACSSNLRFPNTRRPSRVNPWRITSHVYVCYLCPSYLYNTLVIFQ